MSQEEKPWFNHSQIIANIMSARMKELFEHKNIPAWVDFWGTDVCHDWPWWKKQLPYYLNFVC